MRPIHALSASAAAAVAFGAIGAGAHVVLRLATPAWLFALAVPWGMCALFCSWLVWRRALEARLGAPDQVRALAAGWSARRAVARLTGSAAGATLIVLALARPQWGEQVRELERSGIDIVFALDISRSMLATDVAPSRLDAARTEIDRLMRALDGDRVGLVVFAGLAFVQSPLTNDFGAIRLYLDRIEPDDLPVQGTAIGRALHEATKLLLGGASSSVFKRAENQLVIVFTDGEDHETDPVEAATAAFGQGIHVYTVGIGTPEGSRIPLHNDDGTFREFLADRSGQVVVTRLEADQLREIAGAGGGRYVPMPSEGAAAIALEQAIAGYDEEALTSMLRTQYEDRFLLFLMPGGLLLLAATWIPERGRRAAGPMIVAVAALASGSGCGDALMRADPHVLEAVEAVGVGPGEGSADGSAAAEARAALARVPEDGRARPEYDYAVGWVEERSGALRAAQQAYLRALNIHDVPGQVTALFALGNTLLAQEQYEVAIQRYRRALELDPDHAGARRNLEIALLRQFPPCSALDDAAEENDAADAAVALPAGAFEGPYLPPGMQPPSPDDAPPAFVACGGDEDWFAIPVVGGSRLDVEVTLERLRDDTGREEPPAWIAPESVRVVLLDVDRRTVLGRDAGPPMSPQDGGIDARDVSRSIPDVRLAPNVDGEAFVYLAVQVDDPLEYSYRVGVHLVPPCWALEDAHEPNDAREAATPTETGDYDGRSCPGNADWFGAVANPGDNLFVDVAGPRGDDDAPVSLDARWFLGDAPAAARTETLSGAGTAFAIRDATEVTSAWLELYNLGQNAAQYRASVFQFPPCPEGNDRFEPNDSPDAAHALDLQQAPPPLRHLRLCDGDLDWFTVALPPVDEEDREGQERRPFSALALVERPDLVIQVGLYDPRSGRQLAVSTPIAGADARSAFGATTGAGAVAFTELPWEQTSVVVLVAGAQPAFYDLDFPYTQQQQEQQGQDADDPDGSSEGSQADRPQDPEDGSGGAPEDMPEPAGTESPPDTAEPAPPDGSASDLMELLESLDPADVNLPLQQALEAAPAQRMADEW